MSRAWTRLALNCVDYCAGSARGAQCGLTCGQARHASSVTMPDFDYTPPAYTGPSREEVINMRKKYVNPGKLILLRIGFCRNATPPGAMIV